MVEHQTSRRHQQGSVGVSDIQVCSWKDPSLWHPRKLDVVELSNVIAKTVNVTTYLTQVIDCFKQTKCFTTLANVAMQTPQTADSFTNVHNVLRSMVVDIGRQVDSLASNTGNDEEPSHVVGQKEHLLHKCSWHTDSHCIVRNKQQLLHRQDA